MKGVPLCCKKMVVSKWDDGVVFLKRLLAIMAAMK